MLDKSVNMKHFVHYLSRKVKIRNTLENPFFSQEQNSDEGFNRPMFHITRRMLGSVTEIKKGSIIWLFSILKTPWGSLPPSLDAKIVVEKVEVLNDGKIKFHAGEDSRWFPLSNATTLIQNLNTINKAGKENKLWGNINKPLGLYLQSIRKLNDFGEIVKYSDFISSAKFDFISYRIKDGTKPAFIKTQNLIQEGHIVFWDRYSLPRRLVERRENLSDAKLDKYLLTMINCSNQVFGIETLKYSEENSYSAKEADIAKKLMKYVSVKN